MTVLISCSRCVIYKVDLAPWHARMCDMGVWGCVCVRGVTWEGAQVGVCVCIQMG